MKQSTGRITGVKSAEYIADQAVLQSVLENLIQEPYHWVLNTEMDWKSKGFAVVGSSIMVPRSRGRTGDIIASVGDYVVNMNDGRKLIVFTPELKARIERNDFGWIQ